MLIVEAIVATACCGGARNRATRWVACRVGTIKRHSDTVNAGLAGGGTKTVIVVIAPDAITDAVGRWDEAEVNGAVGISVPRWALSTGTAGGQIGFASGL